MAQSSQTRRYVRIIVGASSAIAGLIFLSQSSFFKLQCNDNKASQISLFAVLSALMVFVVFAAPNWNHALRKIWARNFSAKLAVDCFFMAIVWTLAFLIKFPRFDVHSNFREACGFQVSHGSQYSLFSVAAFALLVLLLSSERQKRLELGFFGVLIGLIMDTSMEIPAMHDGPNGWYILGSVVYCIGLVFLKHFIESSMEKGGDYSLLPEKFKGRYKRGILKEHHRNGFVFCLALVGIVCLYFSPFSELQFEGSANLKGVFFITISLLLGFSLLRAREFIDVLVIKCHENYLMKAAVKTLMLAVVSAVIFMTKYPRFRVHAKHRESCGADRSNNKRLISERNRFDVFSSGSFSLFALAVSCGGENPVKLGIFSFLLELTMDAAIEIVGDGDARYAVLAGAYCASLIVAKSYWDSKIGVVREASTDEKPLIERGGDVELDVDEEEEEEEGDVAAREGWESGEGASSRAEEGDKSLNHRQRYVEKRREKAKREKQRMRKNRKNHKDDIWVS